MAKTSQKKRVPKPRCVFCLLVVDKNERCDILNIIVCWRHHDLVDKFIAYLDNEFDTLKNDLRKYRIQ